MYVEVVTNNDIEIDSKDIKKYLRELCKIIQPKVNEITENLHEELNKTYTHHIEELRGLFLHYT